MIYNKGFVLGQLTYFIEIMDCIKEEVVPKEEFEHVSAEEDIFRLTFTPESELGTKMIFDVPVSKKEQAYMELYRSILGFGVKFVNTPEKIKHAFIKDIEE